MLEIEDRKIKDKGYLEEQVKYFGELFFMRLKSDKSCLLWSILSTKNISTRLKVKMLWGKYVFSQLSLVEREAVEDGCLGESLEWWYPIGKDGRGDGNGCSHILETVLRRIDIMRCIAASVHTWASPRTNTCVHAVIVKQYPMSCASAWGFFFFFLNGKQQFPLFLGIADDHMLII